ncbi:MAG: response regulator transcription factor [Actinomycetota bacterium]
MPEEQVSVVVLQERMRLFREGLTLLLDAEPDFSVAASVADAGGLVQACEEIRPDVVVLEADVREWDAARLVAALRKRSRRLRVVGTYAELDRLQAGRFKQAGVQCLVGRDGGYGALLDALRSRRPTTAPAAFAPPGPAAGPKGSLTPRQVEVLRLVGNGATTREISQALGISPKTVENHKQRLFARLGVQNQAHAVAVAIRDGLLSCTRAKAGESRG